jgi:uncharacterized protein YndB with AHSA1/START domain
MSDHMSEQAPDRVERASKMVTAPPQQIFDLLADPAQHHTIDGSGTVREALTNAPERLTLGARFGMKMKLGLPYRITNEVVEFDEPSVIAWRHFGGHIWRYRLQEVDGGTLVTEEFDWRTAKSPPMLKVTRTPERNRKAIEATLDRLAAHFAD